MARMFVGKLGPDEGRRVSIVVRTFVTGVALLSFLMSQPPISRAADISVGANSVGVTPEIVGYNSGHFMPTSNTVDWWRYSGVNGARVWPTPSTIEPTDDNSTWGDGVSSQSGFILRRSVLRSNPLSSSNINWTYIENRYQNNPTDGANIINLKYAFGELRKLGIEPLAEINRTNAGNYAFDAAGTAAGWADRWEHWQHFYIQAFYLARNFDMHRFQMYNEPNLDDDLTIVDYLERLRLASDAMQSAVADVNTIFGRTLSAEIHAPVSAGSVSRYNDWGAPVMDNLHTNYLGQNDPSFNAVHTYAYQQYNSNGEDFGDDLAEIKNLVNADAGGHPMRFAITEFNVHNASTFDGMTATLDTPSKSARMGSILANLSQEQPDELYVFKFSQGPGDTSSGVKKNGTHFVDNGNSAYNIGGVTKGGEVVRLFAKGFAGANERFAATAARVGAADLRLTASYDEQDERYYLFFANEGVIAHDLSVNLTNWGVEPGARVVVEEVSADRHGEVRHVLTVPANRVLSLSQAAQSVLLFSVPKFKPAHEIELSPTDDAMVKAGTNANANFGNSANLFAKHDPVNPAARNVSFIKFNTGSVATAEIEQAILTVNGENTGSASQVIAHVYGLTNDAWNETTINWNNAPNLADSLGTAVDDISENFIEGIGTSASFVGHFTGVAASREMAIDVTRFVQAHPDQEVTFLIAREVRFDGENVDDALSSLRLSSKESGVTVPKLSLMLSALALPGDYDDNGTVDAADYDVWKENFGTTNPAADGDRSGLVDAGDFLVWRKYHGKSLPGANAGAGNAAVPEPTVALLAGLGLVPIAWYRALR